MDCCQCKGIETLFNEKEADAKLKSYRKDGPSKTTRMLIDALRALVPDAEKLTLLDIGGGVGAIQHALLKECVESATGIDASSAYLRAAKEEAERQGHADRITLQHGNFVELAPEVSLADIVTLDRVICCYHDMQSLVGLSVNKAEKLYGLVYPRDTWWMRAGFALSNIYFRLSRNSFRVFVHSAQAVDALVRDNGFRQRTRKTSGFWQVVVYSR